MQHFITLSLLALALCLPVAALGQDKTATEGLDQHNIGPYVPREWKDKTTTEGLALARWVSLNPAVWADSAPPVAQQQDSIEVTVKLPGNAQRQKETCEKYAKAYPSEWSPTVTDAQGRVVQNPESACEFVARHLETHVQTVVASVDANAKAEDERKKEADKVRAELPTKRKKPAQPEGRTN
jgi:hypothetical protein